MAIVKLNKIIIAAPISERDNMLEFIQQKQNIQLIDLKLNDQIDESFKIKGDLCNTIPMETIFNRIKFTLEFLKSYSVKKKSLFESREEINISEFKALDKNNEWEDIYNESKEIEQKINLNKNNIAKIEGNILKYYPYKSFDINDEDINPLKKIACFKGTIAQTFEAKLYEELDSIKGIYIEKIFTDKQDVYLFVLCHMDDEISVDEILKKYGFIKSDIELYKKPSQMLEELQNEKLKLEADLDEQIKKARELSKKLSFIEKVYDFYASKLEKERAVLNLLKTEKTFILEGWTSKENKEPLLKELYNRFENIYVDFQEVAAEENPPILLKNNSLNEPFEAITTMYALPLPGEVDPTPVLTPFYLIFFGMMAADIGYGLVLFLITFIALKYMDLDNEKKKLVKLLLYCSIPTMLFGWVFGGFFGDAIHVKPLWVNPVEDPMKVLYLSAGIGIIHLFTGLGVKAYWFIKNGKPLDAVFDVLFWYMLLTGLLLLLIIGGTVPKYLAIIGAIGLLLTQGRANDSLGGKIFGGIYGLYGITSYIGDILSYSRLLALGLATGLIGTSFNLLIKLLGKGPIAIIGGILIFIAGHTFNFLIGLLGTFVHACRLEYLEFFGKFYEGGGEAFKPLKYNLNFIKIKEDK